MCGENEQYSVLILLASYNGEKYLRTQLESIIDQDYSNWNLIVQDDGSKDKTVEILKEYAEKDKRISFVFNTGSYHGVFYNFHSLINKCRQIKAYDYYMFCDQDDIWDQNKIRVFITKIEEMGRKDIPLLCYADMRLINKSGEIIGKSVDALQGIAYKNKYSVYFSHKVYGCNLIINKVAFQSIPAVDINEKRTRALSHDNYFTKYVALWGKICFLPMQTMSYRRHADNVTKKIAYEHGIKKIISRLSDIEGLEKDHALAYNQSLTAIQYFLPISNELQQKDLLDIRDTIVIGGLKAVRFVLLKRISWGKFQKNISRIIGLWRGKYKKYLMPSERDYI